jgi:hypothetical protein
MLNTVFPVVFSAIDIAWLLFVCNVVTDCSSFASIARKSPALASPKEIALT